jgi:exodeoxyribonuclease VII small subunit
MAKNKAPTFEESFEELDNTVQRLESGELALEEAISLYEHGIQLADQLQRQLEEAELRVRKLKPITVDLEEAEMEEPDTEIEFP